ncbi:MAG: AMIN-like domain-containing (lipo)protein [Mycobacteriales bacterium]
MKRLPAAVLCLSLFALTGCGAGEVDPVGSAPSPSPSAAPSTSAAASPSASASADTEPTAPAEAFPADTGLDTEEPTGGLLSVVAVRVARQEGYDRVVFELAGKQPGEPGWRVEYTDDPAQQGSGNPVKVEGAAALAVFITGTGFPFDTGAEEENDDPTLPPDLAVIEDVVLGATFEGQYEAFVGTAREAPFRVFRLADPARVVIDVRHG